MRTRLSLAVISLLVCLMAGPVKSYAANNPDEVSFRYRISKTELDITLNPNAENLAKLDTIISKLDVSSIQRIIMRSSSSPEGPYSINAQYAHERATWMMGYLSGRYPSIPYNIWQIEEVPEDWDGVADYLRRSTEDYKDEAMQIVRSNAPNRKELLQDLYAGEAWDDLYQYAFPFLRAVKIRIIYSEAGQPAVQPSQPVIQPSQPQQQQQQNTPKDSGQRVAISEIRHTDGKVTPDNAYPLYFARSISTFSKDFDGNAGHIAQIRQAIAGGIDSLSLTSYASPEGPESLNHTLSDRRGQAIRDFLAKETGLPRSKISVTSIGEDWEGFLVKVASSYYGSNRDDVLRIIQDETLGYTAKENAIKQLDGGKTWQSLIQNQMVDLRRVDVIPLRASQPVVDIADAEIVIPEVMLEVDDGPIDLGNRDLHVDLIDICPSCCDRVVSEPINPYVAVSTNLLYDAVTAFNLGLEVPLGRHFTIEADGIYNNMAFSGGRLLDVKFANLGVNYYFNDNGPEMKGWFVSTSVGGGAFNIAGENSSRKGNAMYLNVGAGYSFQLGPEDSHWRLKVAGGVGPVKAPYQYYERNAAGDLTYRRDVTFSWGMPTNLEVSLYYLFQSKR